MATVLFLNNYQTTLGAALSSTATTMTVSSTTGLPSSLASGQFIPMTLTPASNPGSAYEIVYVTGISGSTLTVTRGEEGTSALNWNTGDILYSTNTAQTTGTSMGSPSTDFQTNTLTASGLITANDGINVAGGALTIPNATATNEPPTLSQIFIGNRKAVFTSNGSWTVPDFVTTIWVSGVAGGGGGGGASLGTSGGNGGGAGQSIIKQVLSVTPGDSLSISIGSGGANGGTGNTAGVNGGNTVLTDTTSSTTLITLAGGGGGAAGGAGSVSSNAANNLGALGYPTGASGNVIGGISTGGSGGSSPFGGGGPFSSSRPPAGYSNGAGYGSGGGGGIDAVAGGNGAPGFLIIEW